MLCLLTYLRKGRNSLLSMSEVQKAETQQQEVEDAVKSNVAGGRITETIQKMVPIKDIKADDRAREDYGSDDSWNDFKESIRENNLMHPICLREDYTLAAGGRRLRACTELGWSEIPANILIGEIDEHRLRVLELTENFQRMDLHYSEQVKLVAEIDRLQKEKYGVKKSTSKSASGWSTRATAKMLGESVGKVSQDIKLAEALEVMPELAEAKTKTEAYKQLLIMEEKLLRSELVKRIKEEEEQYPQDRIQKEISNSYIIDPFPGPITAENWQEHGFMKVCEKVSNSTFDFIDLDWPWDLDLAEVALVRGTSKEQLREEYKNIGELPDGLSYEIFAEAVLDECFRVCKPDGWIIVWFSPDPHFESTLRLIRKAGFICRGIPAIWNKGNGQSKVPEVNLGHAYELFFYARKPKSTLVKRGYLDVFNYKPVGHKLKRHKAEKPVDLMADIGSVFTEPGSTWLNPFAGSNNTGLAAADLDCKHLAVDINESHRDGFIVAVNETGPGNYGRFQRAIGRSDE